MTLATITYATDFDINLHRTRLFQEGVKATYARLVELFGEPERIDTDHSRVQWPVEFSDGEIMVIYDWNEDVPVEDVTHWNVGGHSYNGPSRIYDILQGHPILA